jgi:hypothetical protein
MMEAARTFETLVNFYQNTLRYNPESNHLRTHRRENLKSYNLLIFVVGTHWGFFELGTEFLNYVKFDLQSVNPSLTSNLMLHL